MKRRYLAWCVCVSVRVRAITENGMEQWNSHQHHYRHLYHLTVCLARTSNHFCDEHRSSFRVIFFCSVVFDLVVSTLFILIDCLCVSLVSLSLRPASSLSFPCVFVVSQFVCVRLRIHTLHAYIPISRLA